MDVLRQHEIAESGHRILNPFTPEKLMLVGELCRLQAGQRLLDLASGKGEMLCRWADRFGVQGLGVDLSEVFVAAARARAAELGVADRVRFSCGDARRAVSAPAAGPDAGLDAGPDGAGPERASYDLVSCLGATWIGDGLAGTIGLMRPMLRPGGLLLVGEPYWHEDPPPAAFAALGLDPGQCTDLAGTLDRIAATGQELVEMVLSDPDSWDRYVASQWWTVAEWLDRNPGHPDSAAMREYLDGTRRAHLGYGRRYLGWGVFVLRPAPATG